MEKSIPIPNPNNYNSIKIFARNVYSTRHLSKKNDTKLLLIETLENKYFCIINNRHNFYYHKYCIV